MVRKKVRTQFLLFKNPNKQTNKNKWKNNQTNKHGKEKDNSISYFWKKSHGKEKSKNSILTFQKNQ